MTDKTTESEGAENKLPSHTTPTWEMELLISGATVFSLMQLPGPLNRATAVLMNSNAEDIAGLISIVSVYIYASLIALIGAFILHLIARGYWVALVGMHSVYPQGITWGKISSFGPAHRMAAQENTLTIEQLIEQADNRATNIFGLGFGLAGSLVMPTIIVGGMLLVLVLVQYFGADVALWHKLIWLIFFSFMLPWFIAYFFDYYFGEKLDNSGKNAWLKSIFKAYQKIGFGSGNHALVSLYTTNSNSKKIGFLILAAGILFTFAAVMAFSSRGISIDNGAFSGLPKTRSTDAPIIRPENYREMRTERQSLRLTPYINDMVVSENYLRLFIPYQPSKHNELISKNCPDALAAAAVNNGEGMSCLSKYFDIHIDGKPIAVTLLAGMDGDTQQRGMVAMIDVRKLANGQHVLKIKAVPKKSESDKKIEEKFHVIPFWK